MTRATFYVREDPALLNNSVFSGESIYGMKSDMYMYIALRKKLEAAGMNIATQDLHPVAESDVVVVLNETGFFQELQKKGRSRNYILF